MGYRRVRHDWSDSAHVELNSQYVEDVSTFCPKLKEPEKLFRKITWGYLKGTTEIHQITWEQINVEQEALCVGVLSHSVMFDSVTPWTVAISFPNGSSWPRDRSCFSCVSCIGRKILHHYATWEALHTPASQQPHCRTIYYKTHQILPGWATQFLCPSLHGKAMKLFFISTSTETLYLSFNSAPVHRGWAFDISRILWNFMISFS